MLSEEEEQRLELVLGLFKADIDNGNVYATIYKLKGLMWLAEKLKETNDELSQVHAELQKANEENARIMEVYGP